MNTPNIKTFLEHPDREEIIAKILLGTSETDLESWLRAKYGKTASAKLVIPCSKIKSFKKNYLNIYKMVQEDIELARATSSTQELEVILKNNPTYKQTVQEIADKELDIRQVVKNLASAIEARFSQIFDEIQKDPQNINSRVDRVLIEYANTLGGVLEKYHRFTEAPAEQAVVNQNITLNILNEHIVIFQDTMREVLGEIDLEASLLFMEKLSEKLKTLKQPVPDNPKIINNVDAKFLETKTLHDEITKKLDAPE